MEDVVNSQAQVKVSIKLKVTKGKRDIKDSNGAQHQDEQSGPSPTTTPKASRKTKRPRISPLKLSISMIGVEIPKHPAPKRSDGGGLAGRKLRGWDGFWEVEGGTEKELPVDREAFPLYGKLNSIIISMIVEEQMTDF